MQVYNICTDEGSNNNGKLFLINNDDKIHAYESNDSQIGLIFTDCY